MHTISPTSREAQLFKFTDIATFSNDFAPSTSLANADVTEPTNAPSDLVDLANALQNIGITNLTVGNIMEGDELEIDYENSCLYVWRDSDNTESWLCLPLARLTDDLPFFDLIPSDQHALVYFQSSIPFNSQMSMTIGERRYTPFESAEIVNNWSNLQGRAFPVVLLSCGYEADCVPWVITPQFLQALLNTFNRLIM